MPPWVRAATQSKERKLHEIKKATHDWPNMKAPEKVLQLRIDQDQLTMIQFEFSAQLRHMRLDNRLRWLQFRQSMGKNKTKDITREFLVSLGRLVSFIILHDFP